MSRIWLVLSAALLLASTPALAGQRSATVGFSIHDPASGLSLALGSTHRGDYLRVGYDGRYVRHDQRRYRGYRHHRNYRDHRRGYYRDRYYRDGYHRRGHYSRDGYYHRGDRHYRHDHRYRHAHRHNRYCRH